MSENTFILKEAEEVLSTAFLNYAGYNLQRRAIPDARDGLKWGARQLLHSQMLGNFVHNKPFKKAAKSVSQAMGFSYVHGDASAYGTFIRMGKPFAYRYPLQDVNGNYGTLINPDDHSAARYVELRGSELSSYLLKDLEKDTITEWEDTYDLEGKFPKVLPTKGFYNIVNGCLSIGSGMSCSIPPFNLKEVNDCLIKLILNPEISDDELIILPDFPTGATILNEEEVRESLKNGHGKSCRIRATIEYDSTERCFIVKELPYSTYTNTICKELAQLIEEDETIGIKSFNDYTGQTPDLRIYLNKNANPDKVLKKLLKNTSLQSWYSINMTMLDEGKTPRIFTWREALQAHIDHEKEVYRRSFNYDINKMKARIHILEGLFICLASIDEVVKTIKKSKSAAAAKDALCNNFLLDEIQAKAVLDLKLSRLTHLEVEKLKEEKLELLSKIEKIEKILNTEELFNNELIKGWEEVSKKFGDKRRTRILNISTSEEDEPTEICNLQVSLTNKNNICVSKVSTLYTQRRGGVGTKFKLDKGEYVKNTEIVENIDTLLFFTDKGNYYPYSAQLLSCGDKTAIESFLPLNDNEKVCAITSFNKKNMKKFIIFITKKGMLKKSLLEDYKTKRTTGVKALELSSDDEICSVLFVNEERLGILTQNGQFLIIKTMDINSVGRTAKGVKGIKLNEDDLVVSSKIIPDGVKEYVSITEQGYIKRTSASEFFTATRYTKGSKLHKLKDETDKLIDFTCLLDEKEIVITASTSQIKLSIEEVPLLLKGAQGVKSIKISEKSKIISVKKV